MDGSATEHQISDGVGVGIRAAPTDRFTLNGDHPDHALLTPCLSESVGVVHVGRPVATVLIKVCPGRGLNGEGHVLCVNCAYYKGSGTQEVGSGVQCVCCHSAGRGAAVEQNAQGSDDDDLKHGVKW